MDEERRAEAIDLARIRQYRCALRQLTAPTWVIETPWIKYVLWAIVVGDVHEWQGTLS